jgi:hypothetical protein
MVLKTLGAFLLKTDSLSDESADELSTVRDGFDGS